MSTPDDTSPRRSQAVAWLVPLFILSGATSLVYETIWERQLHKVSGTSAVGVITVLAAFMSGLAIGGFLSGRVADRVRRPVLAYGLLELGIGLYALLFPLLLKVVGPLVTGFYASASPGPTAFALFQFLVYGSMLLPPTIAMGATLPLLVRFVTTSGEEAGHRVSQLYGANTLGAVLGVGMAGFVLLPSLGLSQTTLLAASGNLLLFLASLALQRSSGELSPPPAAESAAAPAAPWVRSIYALAFMAGLASLIDEVAWFRLMVLNLGGSAYAFSVMLLAFLLGIGLGGRAVGRWADRAYAEGGPTGVLRLGAGIQIYIAASAYICMYLYNKLPVIYTWLFTAIEKSMETSNLLLWVIQLFLAIGVMVPPAFGMGAFFPLLVRGAARGPELGAPVGRIYGWNTVGAILGVALGGLVLLPRPEPGTWFDPLFMHPDYRLRGTVLLGISINLFAAFFCWRGSEQASLGTPSWKSQLGWLAAVAWTAGIIHRLPPPWEPMMITSGMYHYVSEIPLDERNEEGVRAYAVEPYEMLFYEEGLSSVVTVARARRSNNMWLANMGKIDASTRVDMPTQVLVAQLPFMFRPEAQDVVVVGLASGITAGSAALQPGPSIIEVAELEPAIERASRLFDEHNNRPLDDTRVRLIKNDGRNHILLQPPGRYDIVINEPSNPWISGVSNLFTREFWEMGKTKLKPGGVWAQWIQTYSMGPEDLKSLLRTFATVFPHVQLFSTIEEADLVLVGSESPLELTYGKAEKLVLGHAPVGMDLRQVDCGLPADILARWQLDERSILAFTSDVEFNTDDNMRIEYSAPLYLHKDTSEANLRNLLHEGGAATAVPWSSVSGHEQLLALAEAYGRRSDWTRGLMVLKRAEELSPGDPRVAELFTSYQQKLAQELDGDEEEEE